MALNAETVFYLKMEFYECNLFCNMYVKIYKRILYKAYIIIFEIKSM